MWQGALRSDRYKLKGDKEALKCEAKLLNGDGKVLKVDGEDIEGDEKVLKGPKGFKGQRGCIKGRREVLRGLDK